MAFPYPGRHAQLFDAATRANGVLEWSDLQDLVDRAVRAAAVDEYSAKGLKQGYEKVFAELTSRAGGASRLTRQQFLDAMGEAVMDSSAMAAFEGLAMAVFGAVDANHNGKLTSDEFVRFVKSVAPDVPEDAARSEFAQIGVSGGLISPEDAVRSARQFLTNPDSGYTPGGVFVHLGMGK